MVVQRGSNPIPLICFRFDPVNCVCTHALRWCTHSCNNEGNNNCWLYLWNCSSSIGKLKSAIIIVMDVYCCHYDYYNMCIIHMVTGIKSSVCNIEKSGIEFSWVWGYLWALRRGTMSQRTWHTSYIPGAWTRNSSTVPLMYMWHWHPRSNLDPSMSYNSPIKVMPHLPHPGERWGWGGD
jgi:hypothetical protein